MRVWLEEGACKGMGFCFSDHGILANPDQDNNFPPGLNIDIKNNICLYYNVVEAYPHFGFALLRIFHICLRALFGHDFWVLMILGNWKPWPWWLRKGNDRKTAPERGAGRILGYMTLSQFSNFISRRLSRKYPVTVDPNETFAEMLLSFQSEVGGQVDIQIRRCGEYFASGATYCSPSEVGCCLPRLTAPTGGQVFHEFEKRALRPANLLEGCAFVIAWQHLLPEKRPIAMLGSQSRWIENLAVAPYFHRINGRLALEVHQTVTWEDWPKAFRFLAVCK